MELVLVDSNPAAEDRKATAWQSTSSGALADDIALSPCEAAGQVAGRRILVVDDNEDAALLLELSLMQTGHEVRVASNAEDALALVADWVPDIAILDIGLPVLDGYELAGRLRAMPQLSRLRLIALTGYGSAEHRDRAQRAGFDAHVTKPARMDALRAVLLG
ncbi:MAG TPA: response regulator [Kofleriaceae bacterium]|jgi:CheY-like chemotaxis protein